jgi:branched-chain amino acid transport system permease protein
MRGRLQDTDYIGLVLWIFRAVIISLILWGTISTILNNPYTSRQWVDFFMFGITQGSTYALIAIGHTLVYDMLFMINFAHGEFFMSGAMTATIFIAVPMSNCGFLARQPFLALVLITVVAMAVSGLIAVLTERVAYRPLRKAPRLVPSVAAIGASFFWRYLFRDLYGSGVKAFPEVPALAETIPFLGTELLKSHLVVIVVTSLMLIGLYFFIMRTKTGKAIRAVAGNKDVAALMGISIDRTVTITFAIGGAMAGMAGVLLALVFRKVHFFMGFFPGIKAFTAAALGGIGSIPGAAIGGLLLGMFESVAPGLFLESFGIPTPYQLKDVIALTMLVLVLILRPQGILGEGSQNRRNLQKG